MKKILFINGHLNVGGVEKSLVNLLRNINYNRYEVDLLLLEELGDYEKEIPKDVHIILKSLYGTYGNLFTCLKKAVLHKDIFSLKMRIIFMITKFTKKENIKFAKKLLTNNNEYDYVIGFRPGICTELAAYAVTAKKKIGWWHHGVINIDMKGYSETCKYLDAIVCVSKGCKEMLSQISLIQRRKLVYIPNMIDTKEIYQKSLQSNTHYASCKMNIVSIGRLEEEKHFENIVDAAEKLKTNNITNFHWVIVGDGSQRSHIEKKIRDFQLSKYITLVGSKKNPYVFLKDAYLYAHPSYVESQGLTILEAMAMGIPCVVTHAVGPDEFIDDGINGILTDKNPESFAEKVYQIISNKSLYEKIKSNTKCPEEYNPENVICKVEQLIS